MRRIGWTGALAPLLFQLGCALPDPQRRLADLDERRLEVKFENGGASVVLSYQSELALEPEDEDGAQGGAPQPGEWIGPPPGFVSVHRCRHPLVSVGGRSQPVGITASINGRVLEGVGRSLLSRDLTAGSSMAPFICTTSWVIPHLDPLQEFEVALDESPTFQSLTARWALPAAPRVLAAARTARGVALDMEGVDTLQASNLNVLVVDSAGRGMTLFGGLVIEAGHVEAYLFSEADPLPPDALERQELLARAVEVQVVSESAVPPAHCKEPRGCGISYILVAPLP